MKNTKQDSQKTQKTNLRKRLSQLNNTGKKALKIGLASTIGFIGAHVWQKTHIGTPEQEEANRKANIEQVEHEVEKQMPKVVGTNTVGKVATGTTKKIAKTGADHGAKVRIAIAKLKARRNQEKP